MNSSVIAQRLSRWKYLLVAVALLAVAPVDLVPQAGPAQAIGFVAKVKGNWVRQSDQKVLTHGDELYPGTTLRTGTPQNGSIEIALFDGTVFKKECGQQSPCDGITFSVPNVLNGPRGFVSFLNRYFEARPVVSRVFGTSRSIGVNGPSDAVLQAGARSVDLRPALLRIPSGHWIVTISDASVPDKTITNGEVIWPAKTAVPLPQGTSRGIYRLDIATPDGRTLGHSAAILLEPPSTYMRSEREFLGARQLSQKWTALDEQEVHEFLVQSLYAIALGAAK